MDDTAEFLVIEEFDHENEKRIVVSPRVLEQEQYMKGKL